MVRVALCRLLLIAGASGIFGSIAAAKQPSTTSSQERALEAMLHARGYPPGAFMPADQSSPIEEVMIAPVFHRPFVCDIHSQGSLADLGDALGSDCMVVGGVEGDTGFMSLHRADGRTNADWYGWQAEVHAPFDGAVVTVDINPITNEPGVQGKPPASGMIFRRDDGTYVTYAHVTAPRVKPGDHVVAGQVVALVGNNGMARNPHIHIGAWRGRKALQIRWDAAAMGKIKGLADQ